MTTINRLRTPPVMVGLLLAGLLLFAVIGIVRTATGANSAVVADAMQNNVGAAVVRPVAIATASVLPIGATKVDPNDGYKWAWLGAVWLSCRHLDPLGLTYNANANDLALMTWQTMTMDNKRAIAGVCE